MVPTAPAFVLGTPAVVTLTPEEEDDTGAVTTLEIEAVSQGRATLGWVDGEWEPKVSPGLSRGLARWALGRDGSLVW